MLKTQGGEDLTCKRTKAVIGVTIILMIFFTAPCSFCANTTYKGFKLLQEGECKPMDRDSVAQLSAEWQRYAAFVKVCGLKENSTSVTEVSIVSIWVNDYYEANFPSGPRKWEKFPLPIIVDNSLRKIGQLPEIYPLDDITAPDVYYGKWQNGMPRQIRVDVQNPAEGGDYYYKDLIWNEKSHSYRMEHSEAIDGRRPK